MSTRQKDGRFDDDPTTSDPIGYLHAKIPVSAYRGVAPTTNRRTSTDYHGEPIVLTGRVNGQPVAVVLHLTVSEALTLRMALEKWIPYSQKRKDIRDALLLTLGKQDFDAASFE